MPAYNDRILSGSWLDSVVHGMGARLRFCKAPERFLTDLVRDGLWLASNGRTPFFWTVYPDGTVITAEPPSQIIPDFVSDLTRGPDAWYYIVYFDADGNATDIAQFGL